MVRRAAGLAAAQAGRLLFGVGLAFAMADPLHVFNAPPAWAWGGSGLGVGLLCSSMGVLPDMRRFVADLLTSLALAALIIAGFLLRVYAWYQPHSLNARDTLTLSVSAAVFVLAFVAQLQLRRPRR